jgi:uncharacterized protein YybS (DUF2232 family)
MGEPTLTDCGSLINRASHSFSRVLPIFDRSGPAAALQPLAIALVFYFGGAELALGYALLALMAVLLPAAIDRRWPVEWAVAAVAGTMLAALYGCLIYLFGSFSQIRPVLREVLRQNFQASLGVYDKIGLSPESVEMLKERAPEIIEGLLRILPALAFAGFTALILLNLFLLLRRFPGERLLLASAGNLREWKAPEILIWCFILSGFALFLPGWAIRGATLNLFLMISVFYFFQGLSIIAYYFHRKKVPYFLRSLAYVLIVFEQILTLLVVGLGLFDLWGDFRRLKKKDLHPSGAS